MGISIFDQIDKPGAITSLLQAMGPQVTPSAAQPTPGIINNINPPQAAQLPPPSQQFNVAPGMQQQRPRMLSRVHDYIVNHSGGQTPPGVEELVNAGLLTPEQVKAAKPGLLSLIAGTAANTEGGGQAVYMNNLNNILAMKGVATRIGEERRIQAVRDRMATMFEPKPNETLEQERDRIEKMYSYAVQHGDLATAKQLEGAATESLKRPTASSMAKVIGPGATLVDPSGQVLYQSPMKDPSKNRQLVTGQEGIFELRDDGIYNVATGQKYTGSGVHPVSMLPNYTPVTIAGANPDAPPVVVPFNTKAGTAGTPIGEAKPTTTRIESALNTASKARLEAAVSEMNNAHSNMSEYERKLATGQANISGLSQFLSSTANTFTHDDPVSKVTQSAALAILNRKNPELGRYIRRGLSFAEGESMISQRPSDFRTRMAAFLSTAASGATPEMIGDIESRRNSILTPLNETIQATRKKASAPTGQTLPRVPGAKTPTYEEWKKSMGIP